MPSLTSCLKKAGSVIDAADRAAIIERARILRAEGVATGEAAVRAVQDRMALVQQELDALAPVAAEAEAGPVSEEAQRYERAAPTITRDQERELYAFLREQVGEDAYRYEVIAKRIGRVADGRGSDADEQTTREWLAAMAEDGTAKQRAAAQSEADRKAAAEEGERRESARTAESLAKLRRGEAENPRFQAFLDTLEQADLDSHDRIASFNTDYMAFINARVGEYKRENKISRSDVGGDKALDEFIRKWADEHLSERVKAKRKPAAPSRTPLLDAFKATVGGLYDGATGVEAFKAAYRAVRDGEQAQRVELNKLTRAELVDTFGIMRTDAKKDEMVQMALRSILDAFALGKQYGPTSYMMTRGGHENYLKQRAEALDALVENTTEDDLKAYAEQRKKAREERAAARAEAVEAIKNPKTIADFRQFMSYHVRDGKTVREARALLTPEQQSAYDLLEAEQSRAARKDRKDEQRDVRVAGQTVDGQIIATKHTKKGHDLFVVQLAERVSREDYETLNTSAKKIGGYYSSYRGGGAIPGFQFTDRTQAEAFVKLAQGDKTAASEAAAARRDAFQDDRSQTAVQRLTEMAERLDERADESLGRERKANTERRARFAGAAEAAARADKAMAATMRNIAGAIEAGRAKFLDRVRQKVQVEMLQGFVRSAKDAELRAKYLSYADQQRHQGEPPTAETAEFADWPTYSAYRSDLASLARQLLDVDGTKLMGQRLMKVADDVTEAFAQWAREGLNFARLSVYTTQGGKRPSFPTKDDAERAIARSGYKGKAIAWNVKRGDHTIIMSPSEAIARGIWKGDGDKRITLDPEFGAELVQKIGRANRRGAKVSVPWQFETAHDRRAAFARMGIETPFEFRAALREFIGLREQPAEADKVKQLERAMIGKRNDGFDFFPTPEATADEMVAAADIQPGMRVLEPSAGIGHIAERIRAAGFEPDVVEIGHDRRELLEAKGFNVVGQDFLEFTDADQEARGFTYGDVFRAQDGTLGVMRGGGGLGSDRVRLEPLDESGQPDARRAQFENFADLEPVEKRGVGSGYDRILMNPPFSDGRDITHVRHAYSLLKPGGRLVAIMGEGAFTASRKQAEEFRAWLDAVGGTEEKLPEGTFLDPSLPVNTGANARMVVIEKPEGDIKFSLASDSPIFYSELSRQVEKVGMNAAPAVSWKAWLKGLPAKGVKPDEIAWTGIEDWLDLQQGKVTKPQVLAFLAANGVQVEETVLGAPDESDIEALLSDEVGAGMTREDAIEYLGNDEGATPPKYATYTLPGGTNYRELLLTLPGGRKERLAQRIAEINDAMAGTEGNAYRVLWEERQRVFAEWQGADDNTYRSTHWDQPNVLAHIRVNDRTDADGRRVLFVEEIQSDWGQAAKKHGAYNPEKPWHLIDARQAAGKLGEFATEDEAKKAGAALGLPSFDWIDMRKEGVPAAPFVQKTDAWVALAVKRVIAMAAREGYDRVAFVNGEQSADRYDLSKQVKEIRWDTRGDGDAEVRRVIIEPQDNDRPITATVRVRDGMVTKSIPDAFAGKPLDEVVGKDIAKHILETPDDALRGLDLKVGGEGMKAFYDKIVPTVAKDVLKKLGGGAMGTVRLEKPAYDFTVRQNGGVFDVLRDDAVVATYSAWDAAEREAERRNTAADGKATTQPGFDITDALRAKASAGLPLFSVDGKRRASENPPDGGERASAEDARAVLALQAAFGRAGEGLGLVAAPARAAAGDGELPQGPDRARVAAQELAARLFGKRLTFFKAARPVLNGVFNPQQPDRVFVRFDADKPHMAITGHELGHALRNDQPAIYERLKNRILELARDKDQHDMLLQLQRLKAQLPQLPQDTLDEEFVANVIGDRFMEPQFWKAMAKDQPGGFRQVIDAILSWLDDLIARLLDKRPFGTDVYLSDIKAARQAVAQALREYSGAEVGTVDDGELKLSLSNHTPEEQEALARAGIGRPAKLPQRMRSAWDSLVGVLRSRDALAAEFRQGVLDQFHGIRQATAREIGGLPVDQDPYITARLANGGTSGVMRALLLHGQAAWSANGQHLVKIPGTKGLLDVMAPLGDDINDWFGWMIGNRAARLKREGRENNFTDDQIKALQGLAKTPEQKAAFRKAASEYAAFKRSVLDIAEQAGLIDPDGRKVWDNADYIPFYRQIDEKAAFSPTGRKGLAGQSSGIRVLRGGESALNDPMENLLMNFSRLIDASLKNNAIRKTVGVLKHTDVVTKVGYDMSAEIVPAAQVMKRLIEAGTPEAVLDVIPPEAFEGMAKMWALQAPSDPDVVRVMVGGKPQFYRVNDPLLLRALTSFVPFDFPGLGVMRGAKRLLTRLVTSTPEFMARNWIRDSLASQAITRDGFNPAKSVQGILKSYAETGAFEPMLFAGASFQAGNVNAADPAGTAVAMRRALRRKGLSAASADEFMSTVWDSAARGAEHYFEISEAIENANREAVYEAALRAGKGPTVAAYEAKDLMDFGLRGSWAGYQLLADVLPFFNARVQGLYRLGRADPKRLLAVGGLIMVASLLLALANDGEDWYEELPDWDKDTYWHFKVAGKHFRIPKPFEIGVIFATYPERIGRYLKGLDSGSKTARRLWANARDQLAIDLRPQLIRPMVDAYYNRDSFRERPIETVSDEGKLPQARYSTLTSDTTRVVGQGLAPVVNALDMGPKKLEFLVQGYFGTAGMYALALSDMLVRELEGKPAGPTMRWDDVPLVRTFYREDPARATQFESDLYSLRDQVGKIARTLKAYQRDGDAAKASEILLEHRAKLGVQGALERSARTLSSLNKARDQIMLDEDMAPAEKRARLDELQRKRNALARQVMTHPAVKAVQ